MYVPATLKMNMLLAEAFLADEHQEQIAHHFLTAQEKASLFQDYPVNLHQGPSLN